MKWMRNRELPSWAYLLGCLLLLLGALIDIFTKNLLGMPLICLGIWLARWWYEGSADHPRFQKMSERQLRVYQRIISVASWGILILTVVSFF